MTRPSLLAAACVLLCAWVMPSAAAQETMVGHWEGLMRREGAALAVGFNFASSPTGLKGDFTSESQSAMEYPLDFVRFTPPAVHFELANGNVVFRGGLTAAGAIEGTFKEGEAGGTFSLTRTRPPPLPYRIEEVTFGNGAAELSGTLLIPAGKGPFPAIVFLHGSGPETRWGTSRFRADRFARRGVAALIYDKRGSGRSTGDWKRSTFEELAGDALAGLRLLRRRAEISPGRVGVYGHSQGGFIAPLVASLSKDVAYVVSASSYGGPVYEQDIYRLRQSLRANGYSEEESRRAMALYTMFIDVARSGEGWGQFQEEVRRSSRERWFAFLELPAADDWLWEYYRPVGNFDNLPYWEKVTVPVLLVYGERDQLLPPGESLRKIEGALRRAGNKDYTAVLIPRAAHNLTVAQEPGQPFEWWHTALGLNDLLTAWVRLRFAADGGADKQD